MFARKSLFARLARSVAANSCRFSRESSIMRRSDAKRVAAATPSVI
jgi:hypothetical protein